MMAMCPSCFELSSDILSKPCCTCAAKPIRVSVELVNIVKILINLGFKVAYANCETSEDSDSRGKVTQISIDFETLYPEEMFYELPPDWELTDSYPVLNNEVLGEPFSVLTCVCEHPPTECDQESIDFDKKVTITNLETWLEEKDPESCKAILKLAGCE